MQGIHVSPPTPKICVSTLRGEGERRGVERREGRKEGEGGKERKGEVF